MSGCSAAALANLMALLPDGSRSLIKVQESARAILDKEDNRILASYTAGCVFSEGIVDGSFAPVRVINALWVIFDMFDPPPRP